MITVSLWGVRLLLCKSHVPFQAPVAQTKFEAHKAKPVSPKPSYNIYNNIYIMIISCQLRKIKQLVQIEIEI